MAVPTWATSMVRNYRQMFKEKYGRETRTSDESIWQICNSVFNDEDKATEDNDRVEMMKEIELAIHTDN